MHQQLTLAVVQTHHEDLKRLSRHPRPGTARFPRLARHRSRPTGEVQSRPTTAWTRLVPAR